MRRTLLPTALLALLALVACNADRSGGGAPAEQPPPATEAIDPASVASLVGIVRFAGEPPPRELIPMGGDQFCRGGPPVLSRRLLVGEGGGVEGAVVHVAEGVSQYAFPPSEDSVVIDQKGCLFLPRVAAVRTGQTLLLLNSDPTYHNVRATSKANEDFNLILPQQGMRHEVRFERPETFIPLKCDVHPWMAGLVAVLPHPCFDLTGEDGRFSIEGIPAGEIVLEARHEVLGTVSRRVLLQPGERAEVELVFEGLPES